MNKPRPVRAVKVADDDLDPGIREVLGEVRTALGLYGWKVHAEKSGKHLSFEFRNPLSPISTGMVFESDLPPRELRHRLDEHVKEEPEFAQTMSVDPPRRRRELLSGLRWAATWYGWSNKVFQEVIDTLRGFRVLSKDESTWLMAVGPTVLPEDVKRELTKRRKAQRRRTKSATAPAKPSP